MKASRRIFGIDEVGRGPIAGPVTVCVFSAKSTVDLLQFFPNRKLKDSKKLTKAMRNNIYKTIREYRKLNKDDLDWSIVSKSARYIDSFGINHSINACIKEAIRNLKKKKLFTSDSLLYLDGGLFVKNIYCEQETIIKGDEKIPQIALASILAKVTRDTHMSRLSLKYDNYAWEKNVGYGTKEHYMYIKKFDISKEHRKTYLK